jgi:hypothetical protein
MFTQFFYSSRCIANQKCKKYVANTKLDHVFSRKRSVWFIMHWYYNSNQMLHINIHLICLQISDFTPQYIFSLMFCWPCIIVYQYNETSITHFSFNLLRIKALCMFRSLLAHLQEAPHKRHLVYCVRIMSVGCGRLQFHCNRAIDQVPFVYRLLKMSK